MIKINRGWLKIYLFYGTIFFLLGLVGNVCCNENIISYLEKYTANFKQTILRAQANLKDYSVAKDIGLASENDAVVVDVKQFTPFIVYACPANLKSEDETLFKEMQIKILDNFNKVKIYTIPDPKNWDEKLVDLFTQYDSGQSSARDCILIGLDLFPLTNEQLNYKMTLILPEFLANTLASQLILAYTELFPAIAIQNHPDKIWRVLEFNWEEARTRENLSENNSASSMLLKAMDLLIETLQQNFSNDIKI